MFPKFKFEEVQKQIAECNGDEEKLKALEERLIQLVTDQEKARSNQNSRISRIDRNSCVQSAELLEDWQLETNHRRALEKIQLRVKRQHQ